MCVCFCVDDWVFGVAHWGEEHWGWGRTGVRSEEEAMTEEVISLRSAPEEKYEPDPVKTTTPMDGAEAAHSRTSVMSEYIAWLNAFRREGRASVITTAPSTVSVSTSIVPYSLSIVHTTRLSETSVQLGNHSLALAIRSSTSASS